MIISDSTMTVCWVNTENEPIRTEHVAYHCKDKDKDVELFEIVREYYPHPTSPEDAQVSLLNIRFVERINKKSIQSSKLMLLAHVQNVLIEHYRIIAKLAHTAAEKVIP
jgi:hypothetical protein